MTLNRVITGALYMSPVSKELVIVFRTVGLVHNLLSNTQHYLTTLSIFYTSQYHIQYIFHCLFTVFSIYSQYNYSAVVQYAKCNVKP